MRPNSIQIGTSQGRHASSKASLESQESQRATIGAGRTYITILIRSYLTLILQLTDICVKNGGDHFLAEIGSREFIDNLVSILRMEYLNLEVKNTILRLLQNWSIAFEGKPSLGYVGQICRTLQGEGILSILHAGCLLILHVKASSFLRKISLRQIRPWLILKLHQNGSTRMFAFVAERHSHSQTENTTVGIAVRCMTKHVRQKRWLFLTLESLKKYVCVIHAITR